MTTLADLRWNADNKTPRIISTLKRTGFTVLLVKGSLPSETIEGITAQGDVRSLTIKQAAKLVKRHKR